MSECIYRERRKSESSRHVSSEIVSWVRCEEVIRCRDCKGSQDGPWHRCETFVAHGEDANGFCAWAKRRKND